MTVGEIRDRAPDFGEGFPSTGEFIGAAWQAMWDAMADGQWHPRTAIVKIGADAVGIQPKTAMTLLQKAAQVGVIHARKIGSRRDHRAPREVRRL